MLGKLFSEAVESIDPGPVEGITATGSNALQTFLIPPQVVPSWISFWLYRFASNVRAAAVLEVVVAGGIGVPLYRSFAGFVCRKVCAILIILIASTTLADLAPARSRRRFI